MTTTGQRLHTNRTNCSAALEDSDRSPKRETIRGDSCLCQAFESKNAEIDKSVRVLSQPPFDKVHNSCDCTRNDHKKRDNYAGYDKLEFSIAIFIGRRQRTLRKIGRWCVSGHLEDSPNTAYGSGHRLTNGNGNPGTGSGSAWHAHLARVQTRSLSLFTGGTAVPLLQINSLPKS